MSISTIVVNANNVSLVALPATPGLRSVEFSFTDAVAVDVSPFTGQTQTQAWLGADLWGGTMTLPPLCQADADNWLCFLMELRGMTNALQLGDPLKPLPRGAVQGSVPVVRTAGGTMVAGGTTLYTAGWVHSKARVLLPGDYLQLGYRLHRNLDVVNSDASGYAAISVWPSLREAPANGEAVVLNKPRGLWRLANNKRTWSADISQLTRLSFSLMEYR